VSLAITAYGLPPPPIFCHRGWLLGVPIWLRWTAHGVTEKYIQRLPGRS